MAINPTPAIILKATGAVARRQAASRASTWVLLGATSLGLVVLAFLAYEVIAQGGHRLSMGLLTHYASRNPDNAGVRAALIGTTWVMSCTIFISLPVAIGTAVWLEEFAPKNFLTRIIQLNISNLASVPSIIYGILGLTVFVRLFDLGPSILTGALVLSLMILPMTIIASQEAIKQVPPSIRDGSLALGATKVQTVWFHVLPGAAAGIMTGVILAISRAIGETAALIMIGAVAFIPYDNTSVFEDFTVLPIQIYDWTTRAQGPFQDIAAAAIIVLMVVVISLNLVAVLIRERFRES